MSSEPKFFAKPSEFRTWLNRNSATASELIVGFYKRDSGRPSMTWPESVDEALCVGWIDGVRKRIDDARYQIRFVPRKPSSIWSAINIEKVRVLTDAGRMQASGRMAFAARTAAKSKTYAYEQQGIAALAPKDAAKFRKHKTAWIFFAVQPPSYRKRMLWWVVSAKQEATRDKRLAKLIDASKGGIRL